ncbi:12688_t:CDS:1 [Acaulospora colombiana]|uniref:12688_t:CDS:1 n=1 Tax=Acaulospora colombiana TaxID=27376 RepID=A0ACA9MPK1_9GLOM|nr:12688_t:CDS:1 [Acaulospora colombiana]
MFYIFSIPQFASEKMADFSFREVHGDLFEDSDPTDALAHCVSQDLRMGKGIADIFRKKYNGIPELKSQNKEVGQVASLRRDDRYIFYLITKLSAYGKPTEADFEKSLAELRKLCEEFGVKGLSVPR